MLRPHPSAGRHAEDELAARFPTTSFEVDRASTIRELLAGCDLCIGTITTATLQAALVGTPVIALNLMGFEWRLPLGGATRGARSRTTQRELAAWLDRLVGRRRRCPAARTCSPRSAPGPRATTRPSRDARDPRSHGRGVAHQARESCSVLERQQIGEPGELDDPLHGGGTAPQHQAMGVRA